MGIGAKFASLKKIDSMLRQEGWWTSHQSTQI